MKLATDKRLRVVGINYKDQPDNARRFIGRYGNPFAAVGADGDGRASIDWGVYGVPETFVVGRDGRIAYKLVGPITADNLETTLKPQIEQALARSLARSHCDATIQVPLAVLIRLAWHYRSAASVLRADGRHRRNNRARPRSATSSASRAATVTRNGAPAR